MSHRPGKTHVKAHYQKQDFNKTQAKVNIWRKTQMQGSGDKKASDRMKALYPKSVSCETVASRQRR
jgi:hypothetical protein